MERSEKIEVSCKGLYKERGLWNCLCGSAWMYDSIYGTETCLQKAVV